MIVNNLTAANLVWWFKVLVLRSKVLDFNPYISIPIKAHPCNSEVLHQSLTQIAFFLYSDSFISFYDVKSRF